MFSSPPSPPAVRPPSRAQLLAAAGRTVPDLLPGSSGPPLRVLFCGINPSLWSGFAGLHFARPSNRFWPALHLSGWTRRRLHPTETEALVASGIGITNLVARATARADELTAAELRGGVDHLRHLAREHHPRAVAVLGVTAYRAAFREPRATIGCQERELAGVRVWLLPNPSGLNAHYQMPALADAFREVREFTAAADEALAAPDAGADGCDPASAGAAAQT